MRHKWKKIKNEHIKYKNEDKYVHDSKLCIRCGLKKGYVYLRDWKHLIYFEYGNILSKYILPFDCDNLRSKFLFTKEEFEI